MKTILLTFDVEDWFQVENFKDYIPFSSWNEHELRVEKNIHLILDLLDSFFFKPKATFFILGWIATKIPGMVKEIYKRGHEVASHGNLHHLCTNQSITETKQDLKDGKALLEDVIGQKIYGYRAPSFAINNDILKMIQDTGHTYDSSYNSFAMHKRYGTIDLSAYTKKGAAFKISDDFFELPISNLTINQKTFPLGGGGYFRLIPFPLFKLGMNWVLNKDKAFLFYSHPWEFDPDQPRVEQASTSFKFRHYINLNQTRKKFESLIKNFNNLKFTSCIDYLNQTD
ncbi:XrtA system polysaccharide deacetylase [Desulfobacula sp.]|uniref:XrtA system polysaccharide deacetylase n=1 Tax=Desulfobacula sp. TaxID=2593537 RepID=UPI0039B94F19